MFRHFFSSVNEYADSLSGSSRLQKKNRYMVIGLTLAMGCIVAGLGFVGRTWYISTRESGAEKDLSSYIAQYNHTAKTEHPEWEKIASLFEIGYAQHNSSYIAPYFLAYYADCILQSGDSEKALHTMRTVIEKLSPDSLLYGLFNLKYYLIILDQPNHPDHQKALEGLRALGADKHNNVFEAALFYLGRYHFVHHNVQEARAVWQQLCATSVDESPSPFVQEVQDYLELVE